MRNNNVSVDCEEDESNGIFETPKNQRFMQRQQKKSYTLKYILIMTGSPQSYMQLEKLWGTTKNI